MADRYRKKKRALSDLDRLRLDEFAEEPKKRLRLDELAKKSKKKKRKEAEAPATKKKEAYVQALVAEILEFGRTPKEIKNPMTKEKPKESELALRSRKIKRIF